MGNSEAGVEGNHGLNETDVQFHVHVLQQQNYGQSYGQGGYDQNAYSQGASTNGTSQGGYNQQSSGGYGQQQGTDVR